MTEPDVETLGKIAYESYRSLTGNLLVPWTQQTSQMREVWRGVADAVRMRLELERTQERQAALYAEMERERKYRSRGGDRPSQEGTW